MSDHQHKHDYNRDIVSLLSRIEKHLRKSEDKSFLIWGKFEKITPFLATVVLAGVSSWLTYSLARHQADQAAADKEHELKLTQMERLVGLQKSLLSPNKDEKYAALGILAALGDVGTAARLAAATNDKQALNHILHLAARIGDEPLAKLAINAGADVDSDESQDEGFTTPLARAAANGHSNIVKLLASARADVNKWAIGMTPLMWAVDSESLGCVDELLNAQADVSRSMNNGTTAFHYLWPLDKRGEEDVSIGRKHPHFREDIARRLVNSGYNIKSGEITGRSFLFHSIIFDDIGYVKGLVDLGGDVNQVKREDVLLTAAAGSRKPDIVEYLISKGARIGTPDELKHPAIIALFQSADVDSSNNSYFSRVAQKTTATLKALLKAKPDLEVRDLNGNTAVLLCASDGMIEPFMVLKNNGAKLDATNSGRQTALHRAIANFLVVSSWQQS